jgi:hypothetical protein
VINTHLYVPPLFSCFHFVSQLKQVGVLEVLKSLQKLEIHFVVLNICTITIAKGGFQGVGDQLIWFSADWLGQLDEFGIATGAEREELEAKREGKKRFDLDPPRGPFGTHDAPAIVESHYDVRIVGCSGGVGGKHLGFR